MSLQKGLVGHWTMDDKDTVNGEIRDQSPYSNHGQLNGGITTGQDGVVDESYSFDGSDDDIKIPLSLTREQELGTNSGGSLFAWVKPDTITPSSTYEIFNTALDRNRTLAINTNGELHGYHCCSINEYYDLTANHSDGEWLHVGMYWLIDDGNGNRLLNLYVNGELVVEGVGAADNNVNNGSNWYIGYNTFTGLVDDVRIYDRELSIGEIRQLYQMRSQRKKNVRIFPELVENQSFEQDSLGTDTPTGWVDNSGNWIVTTDHARTGEFCFGNQYNGTATGGSGRAAGVYPSCHAYQEFPDIKPDNKYRASIYLYSPSGSGNGDGSGGEQQYIWEDDGRLRVQAYDSNDSVIGRWETVWMGETTDLNPYEWNYREVVFTTPRKTDYVRMFVDGGDNNNSMGHKDDSHGGNAGLYIDDASLRTYTK